MSKTIKKEAHWVCLNEKEREAERKREGIYLRVCACVETTRAKWMCV